MSASGNEVGDLLQRLWAKQQTTGLSDFVGAEARVSIPVRQSVVDDLVRCIPLPDGCRDPHVTLAGHNLLRGEFTVTKFLLPIKIAFEATIDGAIGFPHSPYLDLTLIKGSLVEIGLNMASLPGFIAVSGKHVRIDFGKILRQQKLDWLIARLLPTTINIQPGIGRIDIRLAVSDAADERR